MRAQRVKTGFHRIGVVIAVVIGVPSIGAILMSLSIGMGWMAKETNIRSSEWLSILGAGAIFLVVAFLGYVAAWTLGWIIAGFAGDEEDSN